MSHIENADAKHAVVRTRAGHQRLARLKSLTNTERLVMEALDGETPGRLVTLRGLRFLMRVIAYHEAGHVVARMFTGQELSHVVRLSIIPGDGCFGRETSEGCTEEAMIEVCPSEAKKQATGRQLLIGLLAGRAAVARMAGEDSREYVLHGDRDKWEIEGSDMFRANHIAGILAGKSGSPWPILEEAEAWTREMLEIPVVWRVVKRLAGRLIKDGSIDGDAMVEVCNKIVLMGAMVPEWRQRLYWLAPVVFSAGGDMTGVAGAKKSCEEGKC